MGTRQSLWDVDNQKSSVQVRQSILYYSESPLCFITNLRSLYYPDQKISYFDIRFISNNILWPQKLLHNYYMNEVSVFSKFKTNGWGLATGLVFAREQAEAGIIMMEVLSVFALSYKQTSQLWWWKHHCNNIYLQQYTFPLKVKASLQQYTFTNLHQPSLFWWSHNTGAQDSTGNPEIQKAFYF